MGTNEYKLFPFFLNLDFEKENAIEELVKEFYENKKLNLLRSLFDFLEPNANYVDAHGYSDGYEVNIERDFYVSFENGNVQVNEKGNIQHIEIDIKIFNQYLNQIKDLQFEIKKIYQGIVEAEKLNKEIAQLFNGAHQSNIHKIFRYHRDLYENTIEEICIEKNETALAQLFNAPSLISEISSQSHDAEVNLIEDSTDFHIDEILERIKEKEKISNINSLPAFDIQEYKKMMVFMENPHIDKRNSNQLIAQFAGSETPLLEERLTEINFRIGQPIFNKKQGFWNYGISDTVSFRGILYRHLIEHINSMRDELGFVPTCAWCGKPINPTGQQISSLKRKQNIYCTNQPSYESCKRQGTTYKQNRKRQKLNEGGD